MANYSNIRNKIISDIKPNNNQEITGQIMQDTLLQMVSLLQDGGYLFKGGATTTTNPIVGDSNVFYLASVKGTYANFGGLQVNDNELAALVYNGSWSKISIDNQIAHLKDIWNVEYLPVFFLRVEFSNDTIAKISIDDVITTDFEAIIDDFINKTAFIFAYNSVNGSSEVNEFLSPVSVRKTEAGDSVEFIFDGINRNRYRVVVNYKDLSIQNQARQLIFLPNVSTLQDGLMSKEDKEKLDTLYTDFTDLTPEVVTMDDYEDDDSPTMGIIVHDRSGGTTKKVKNSGVLLNDLLRKDQFPVATSSKIGGIKSGGGFITVDTDGIVKVNRSQTADNSENDENGDNIVYTYAKKADLPGIATSTVAGIIKGGGDIAVAADGSVTVNNAGVAQMAMQDSSGRVIVNTYVPKTQVATSSAAGLVKSGNDISVASDGTVTVTSATTVDNVPAATSSKIGGVKSGGDILVSSTGEVTVNNAASAEEAVHATRADNATNVTNVPVATTSKIGGIKAGANITVDSNGGVRITYAEVAGSASTADEATTATYAQNATYDNAGNKIVDTYAKKTELPKIATSTVAGIIKGGGDIAVGNDGSVTVNNSAFAMQANLANSALRDGTGAQIDTTYLRYSRASAHGRYYKFLTLKRGPEKGIIRFGIESPLMGYADYMVNWTYDTNTEKGMNLYCLFSTNAQMYNRVKLVRTGNDTFDVYFESNAGNDYPAFVFMGEGGTTESRSITNYIVSTVSAIPENIYKESAGTSAYFHNDVYVLRDYAKGDPILKFISPGHIEKWIRLNRTNNHLEIVDSNGSLTELYASSFVGDLKGTADKAASLSFSNSDDAINIDNYPQADYGVIPIWLNTAEADGYPPGREGLVFQAKYRSEQGSSGTEYVDCLTQFYVGNEGVRHRTIVDYDEATKFENTPWSKINDDCYFNLGTATVASSTSSSAGVTFTGSSAFSSIRTLLDGLSLATMSNAMPNIFLGFSLDTGNGITHYIRTNVSSISRLSNGNYALFAMYQNPLFGDENYVNVLRISITPSSYSCQTLKSL